MTLAPTFHEEAQFWRSGRRHVAGLDEAGRGALAGPVTAAAVIVDPANVDDPLWRQLRDSKLLSPAQREALAPRIEQAALAWSVAHVPSGTIDEMGIAAATRQAMLAAVRSLAVPPDGLLIDWVRLPQLPLPQRSLAKADQRCVSVAAASILAKVARDRLMQELDQAYPRYGFGAHKGYGTAAHLAAIAGEGPCAEHRRSFAPLATDPSLFD